ncbi:TerB family tellurite resistance protein [Aureisphaera galaxeae]|uniref:tellurite resistance TerB family protein n=1 Tax=Aureisphaera galaxeae TaxID=1538023 RepID=UPI002350261C|nr:TerB family tellurite resistance protein [Aureisphaera galaxeae]MDC8006011.1 TerB family tellurite resistance protein [Aureisphaera galaxeae]
MSFTDLFKSGERNSNIGHFASIVNIASANGVISEPEEELLKRFATKLNISESKYVEILKNPTGYPLNPPNSADKRLERMLDLFKMIYADQVLDDEERDLLERYAIGLGYTEELAAKLIKRSIEIFNGGLDLEDYRYLLNKK